MKKCPGCPSNKATEITTKGNKKTRTSKITSLFKSVKKKFKKTIL
jgi:hypothetical protein